MKHIVLRRWSAPGSLLIAGEYLVTEEGGCGVALAAGGRSYLESELSPAGVSGDSDMIMEGRWPKGGEIWTPRGFPRDEDSSSLAAAVWRECRNPKNGLEKILPSLSGRLLVDTCEFYDDRGRKMGFGSSAAAALLYTRGLLFSAQIKPEQLTGCALKAHSIWQGGRGSGYDVLTSANGGAGRFIGGMCPKWDVLNWPDERSDSTGQAANPEPHTLEAWLIKGAEPVRSPDALSRFQRWRSSENRSQYLMSEISEQTETLVRLLHKGGRGENADPGEILKCISSLSISGIQLGEEIGVPGKPILPGEPDIPLYRRESLAMKCLGAGNETVLLLFIPGSLSSREKTALKRMKDRALAVPLKVEHEGLRSELYSGEEK